MAASRKIKPKRHWEEVVREAWEYRDASLGRVPGISDIDGRLPSFELLPKRSIDFGSNVLEPRDIQITECLPEDLVAMLRRGDTSAVEATTAFLRRAALAQRLTNCMTELLPERSLARAQELDDYFLQHKKPIGPLHGLPISVKEMIGMKDLGLNAGYVAWWGKTASENAHVLDILWNAGAVFHARTSQPQSMMHLETDSNLYGVTTNPYNGNISSGGSSGGEGALIGMRGSCLGIGSDIGGSIRSPAANCGIYGFKPTAFRIPTDGWCSTMAGADSIPGVIGPLSTSLSGIKLFMKTIIDSQPWLSEPALIPIPWNPIQISDNQPLKIAVMWNDGVVTPHPPVTRALKELSSRLRTLPNVDIVDWHPHLHDEAWAIISSLYFTDGGTADAATIAESGEPWRPLTTWMLKENPCVKKLSPQKLYYWCEEREAYRKEYAKVWNETKSGDEGRMVDVILCPAAPGVAPRHNTARYWGYTSQWNLLDYPAVVFPVSKVDKKRDVQAMNFKPMTNIDEEHWTLCEFSLPSKWPFLT
ncbi:related to vitamin D3 hydroxylase-associated protein [Phialocephala subalpina]|uniref:amidase n=1 Tax=Phialocephala subalpina TaxID=576137 RepID=A0A1L7WM98_9HELO|nr:related to vitamin D3 hydroxylase-associated protein [Phialocephala subalpina]